MTSTLEGRDSSRPDFQESLISKLAGTPRCAALRRPRTAIEPTYQARAAQRLCLAHVFLDNSPAF